MIIRILRCFLFSLPIWIATVAGATANPPTEFIDAFNAEREARAVPRLKREPRLGRAAQRLAELVIKRGEPASDREFCQAIENAGLPCAGIAQLVTVDTSTPRQVAASFFEDKRTRRTAATVSLNSIGVGYAEKGADKLWYVLIADPPVPANRRWRQMVLDEVNRFRARFSLRALRLKPRLNRAAQAQADDMAERDYFAHESPDGRGPGQRARAAGYRFSLLLENLATGQATPKKAVEGWINSPPHRKAMLDRNVTETGIGYRFLPNDKGKVRTIHYWAMTMARPR